MSVFTSVSEAELSAWLSRYRVGTLVEYAGIAAGIENTNYFLTTSGGRYVLTLFERLTRDELSYYLHLMAHLARCGIPCPAPVADSDDRFLGSLNGRPAAIVTRLTGHSITAPTPAHCASLGAMLAAMHVAGQSYEQQLQNPRGAHWWRETAPLLMPRLTPHDQALLKEELRFQALYRLEDAPRGVVHGDLFRDNVLFEGEASDVRISGVLDFYFAGSDTLLFDLAVAANDWCTDAAGELDGERTRALLAAYHALRPLTALERGAWSVMLRRAALRFWLSRLHDYHLRRNGELTYVKDPGEFRDVLRRHIRCGSNLPWT
jgi:homoserine kinase type II